MGYIQNKFKLATELAASRFQQKEERKNIHAIGTTEVLQLSLKSQLFSP